MIELKHYEMNISFIGDDVKTDFIIPKWDLEFDRVGHQYRILSPHGSPGFRLKILENQRVKLCYIATPQQLYRSQDADWFKEGDWIESCGQYCTATLTCVKDTKEEQIFICTDFRELGIHKNDE